VAASTWPRRFLGAAATAEGARPAGALGPVEAFGADILERACADAGFHREHAE